MTLLKKKRGGGEGITGGSMTTDVIKTLSWNRGIGMGKMRRGERKDFREKRGS